MQLLRDDPDGAAMWGRNVATDLPAQPPAPFIRVERSGGPRVGGPAYWLDKPAIDFHCYGASQDEAERAARLAHAIMSTSSNVTVGDVGVLASAEEVQGVTRLPDTDVELERYLFSMELTTHPIPTTA